MAPSLLGSFCVCGVVLALALASGAQEAGGEKQELVLEFERMALSGQTNLFEVEMPRVSQGDLHIAADRALASSIEFDDSSEMRFTGNVRIEVRKAVIEASSAVFTFADGQLSRGELEGAPVSFSDVGAATQTNITGRAQKMSYDNVARTLRMTGEVWMQRNKTEIRGCDIIYDFEPEDIRAGSADCDDGFRIRVVPDSDERAAAPAAPQ